MLADTVRAHAERRVLVHHGRTVEFRGVGRQERSVRRGEIALQRCVSRPHSIKEPMLKLLTIFCATAFLCLAFPLTASANCGSCAGDEAAAEEAPCAHCAGDAEAPCTCHHGEEAAAEPCAHCAGDADAPCTCHGDDEAEAAGCAHCAGDADAPCTCHGDDEGADEAAGPETAPEEQSLHEQCARCQGDPTAECICHDE